MLNTIELFAGTGGLLDGFEKTNRIKLLSAVEWEKAQVNNLINRLEKKHNILNASELVLNFDIQRVEELFEGWKNDIVYGSNKGLDKIVGNQVVDIISGGPPCQAYSSAGRIRDKDGMKNDYRNFLFESYLKVVERYKPKLIVFENVEGMLSAIPTGERITDLIRKGFNKIGYEITDDLRNNALLDLSEFGVPQKRKRLIIIGIRRDNPDFDYQESLNLFYSNFIDKIKVSDKKTVRDAISDLPPIYPLETQKKRLSHRNDNNINGHSSRFHSERDQNIFYTLAKDIQNNSLKYITTESLKQLYFEETGKKSNVHKYHVLRWDKPSNTIPAHLKKDGLRHIHPDPDQKRTITVREAARLQTFDDDFEFISPMGSSFEMIGNAVPPLFAEKLGHLIVDYYNDILKSERKKASLV
ncbi:DNA cytosine methyltransferase [Alkalibacterium iburiense]|uniref:Cytosine-specific methyltransferase n=1 Tax=Alkalibacterium iburiense TaxID=290589 RepID=A0ABP3GZ64_9LACT